MLNIVTNLHPVQGINNDDHNNGNTKDESEYRQDPQGSMPVVKAVNVSTNKPVLQIEI